MTSLTLTAVVPLAVGDKAEEWQTLRDWGEWSVWWRESVSVTCLLHLTHTYRDSLHHTWVYELFWGQWGGWVVMPCEVGAGRYDIQAGSIPVRPSWLCEYVWERERDTPRWNPLAGWSQTARPPRPVSWPPLMLSPSWNVQPRSSRELSSPRQTQPSAAQTWPVSSPHSLPLLRCGGGIWMRKRQISPCRYLLHFSYSLLRPYKLSACFIILNRCTSSKI